MLRWGKSAFKAGGLRFFAFCDSLDRSSTPQDLQSMIDEAMGKSIRMLSL